MTDFNLGQRWVVDSEPELGLGIVVGCDRRSVDIFFERGECERRYAAERAPLTRIVFEVGDQLKLANGDTYEVFGVTENDGLAIYEVADGHQIPETQLSSEVQLNQPFMRLMTGQIDKPKWFDFRRQLDNALAKTWKNRLKGLLGTRASLIPHQLYIAQSACDREKVRVLLADEVGLGKTIEAGMILSRLLKLERVQRALIVVPNALQVQWLVELVRKFDLLPELYAGEEHDFLSGQIHIVPHAALALEQERLSNSEFDLIIVDEAHHLDADSDEFSSLEILSAIAAHCVLLTATPEQLGIEGHFARLQLLDPAKFSSLAQLKDQEENYAQLNQRLRLLPEGLDQLVADYQLEPNQNDTDVVISQLLDRHGIGRVMYRNVRKAIAGFPKRLPEAIALEEDSWQAKFEWLAQFIRAHDSSDKILVIVHSIDQVFECEQYLWQKHGIDSACFHEQQSLIERDKAAAYFAEAVDGTQVLICSEIGSEGRNFQFSHHLVCLDLPDHPDLLEQRIGRLDRIGQQHDVHLYFPYAADTADAKKYHWYSEILNCVNEQNPAASAVHDEFWPQLLATPENAMTLFTQAKTRQQQLKSEIEQGRDALLEMNSCRQPQADQLREKIAQFEMHTPKALVEMASELFNFHFEETIANAYSLIPSDKMQVGALPGIPAEGCEITFDRELANAREDFKFITWDSPFIVGLWDLLRDSQLGAASVAAFKTRQLPAGHCLMEAGFDLILQSRFAADTRPFLDATSVRALALDISDKDLSALLAENALNANISELKKHVGREIIKAKKDEIPQWYKKVETFAHNQHQQLIDQAKQAAEDFYNNELTRLKTLAAKSGTAIQEQDVTLLELKFAGVLDTLQHHCHLHLSAVRVIVVTDQ